jgi:hypothetical protein
VIDSAAIRSAAMIHTHQRRINAIAPILVHRVLAPEVQRHICRSALADDLRAERAPICVHNDATEPAFWGTPGAPLD